LRLGLVRSGLSFLSIGSIVRLESAYKPLEFGRAAEDLCVVLQHFLCSAAGGHGGGWATPMGECFRITLDVPELVTGTVCTDILNTYSVVQIVTRGLPITPVAASAIRCLSR